MLREGDRRVSIESNSPDMLMEFQSGPSAPLRPVEITTVLEAPVDSYVSFDATPEKGTFTSWTMELKDDEGDVQTFGPYKQSHVTIPGKSILGTRAEGEYNVKMIGITPEGKTVTRDTTVHMVLWKPPVDEQAMRFSVIYEFDESKAITMYDKYLTEIVVPKIPKDGTVIIHGYTDIIGDSEYNQNLSNQRANDVKAIMQSALTNLGRNDVKFEVFGFGEDQNTAPFDNNFPEQRFYNRTVVIDILQKK